MDQRYEADEGGEEIIGRQLRKKNIGRSEKADGDQRVKSGFRKALKMKRLVVIPADSTEALVKAGYTYEFLENYYNPGGGFDQV